MRTIEPGHGIGASMPSDSFIAEPIAQEAPNADENLSHGASRSGQNLAVVVSTSQPPNFSSMMAKRIFSPLVRTLTKP